MEGKVLTFDSIQDVATLRKYVEKHGITEELQAFLNNSKEGIEKICEYCPRDVSIEDIQKNPSYGDVCEYYEKEQEIIMNPKFCRYGRGLISVFLFNEEYRNNDLMAELYNLAITINDSRGIRYDALKRLIERCHKYGYDCWLEKFADNQNLCKIYFDLPCFPSIIFFYIDNRKIDELLSYGNKKVEPIESVVSVIEKSIVEHYDSKLTPENKPFIKI